MKVEQVQQLMPVKIEQVQQLMWMGVRTHVSMLYDPTENPKAAKGECLSNRAFMATTCPEACKDKYEDSDYYVYSI